MCVDFSSMLPNLEIRALTKKHGKTILFKENLLMDKHVVSLSTNAYIHSFQYIVLRITTLMLS